MDHFMAITATFAEHRDPEKARGWRIICGTNSHFTGFRPRKDAS